MHVSGSDSNAPFVHSHFFPEALKDENAGRTQEEQKENHSREVESSKISAQEDTINIQHAPDATHATPATHDGQNHLGNGGTTGADPNVHSETAEKQQDQRKDAVFFNDSGSVTPSRAGSVVDIFG